MKDKKDKIVALFHNSEMGDGSNQNILKLVSSIEDDVRKSTNESDGRLLVSVF
jgi:RecA/RadA recombinase